MFTRAPAIQLASAAPGIKRQKEASRQYQFENTPAQSAVQMKDVASSALTQGHFICLGRTGARLPVGSRFPGGVYGAPKRWPRRRRRLPPVAPWDGAVLAGITAPTAEARSSERWVRKAVGVTPKAMVMSTNEAGGERPRRSCGETRISSQWRRHACANTRVRTDRSRGFAAWLVHGRRSG